eukprot:gene83-110_t
MPSDTASKSPTYPTHDIHIANVKLYAQVVKPFVQVGTYPTRNFATLGPSYTGQVSGLILYLSILQSPTKEEAPFLPKLQGKFAEFLNQESLEHLRILSSTTCVGLRTITFSSSGGFASQTYTYWLQPRISSRGRPFTSSRGNLSFSVCWFPTNINVTYAYIFFSNQSTASYLAASALLECSPTPYYPNNWTSFVQLSIYFGTLADAFGVRLDTHFGEYELFPGLISLSPLPTAHPRMLQHPPVRPSTLFYQRFSLAMGRSPGFASSFYDLTPYSDSLSHAVTSWYKPEAPTACKRMVSGTFHSLIQGTFHLSLTPCQMVLADSVNFSPESTYSGTSSFNLIYLDRTITFYALQPHISRNCCDVSVPQVRFSINRDKSNFIGLGCPIRKSADQFVLTNPRSLSQFVTSFIASESQGIPHTLLHYFFCTIQPSIFLFQHGLSSYLNVLIYIN